MGKNNERTIAAYDSQFKEYIENTPHVISRTARQWLDASLEGLPSDAQILEIGSGFGHDADYIEQKGYVVQRSDATPGFVHLLRNQGYAAQQLNILTDEITGHYDFVIANAVFHHFDDMEASQASKRVYNALRIDGRFALSLRIGLIQGWSEEKLGIPRYFTHWDRPGIESTIRKVGFASIVATDGNKVNFPWLHIIARK